MHILYSCMHAHGQIHVHVHNMILHIQVLNVHLRICVLQVDVCIRVYCAVVDTNIHTGDCKIIIKAL